MPFEKISLAAFDRMIGVHLRGTFMVTQAFYPGMVERGFGRIINFASQLAYKGGVNVAHYCAAKGGIVGLTRALSQEAAPKGVLVNAIAPGPIDTDMLPASARTGRRGSRRSCRSGASATSTRSRPTALLLASKAGSNYVGQTLSPTVATSSSDAGLPTGGRGRAPPSLRRRGWRVRRGRRRRLVRSGGGG